MTNREEESLEKKRAFGKRRRLFRIVDDPGKMSVEHSA
jgi:hypothetical protein